MAKNKKTLSYHLTLSERLKFIYIYIYIYIYIHTHTHNGLPWWLSSKESTCNSGDIKRLEFDPLVGKISWRRANSALQYSWLENPPDREAWWATVHGVAKSGTRLKQLSMHAYNNTKYQWGKYQWGCTATRTPGFLKCKMIQSLCKTIWQFLIKLNTSCHMTPKPHS